MELSPKQAEFNAAMELYNGRHRYVWFGHFVSVVNVALQMYLLTRWRQYQIDLSWQVFSLAVAYFMTDFINGLVHMYMDGNDRYDSIWGPLIANFHLHHKYPQYRKNNILVVYFIETGSKVWLIGYLLIVAGLAAFSGMNAVVLNILLLVGILSSIAEVSHYLCHSSNSPPAKFLAQIGLLLCKRHHAPHHLQDNTNYAFLNGLSDPLLNLIAAQCSKGYKQNTDLHFANYDVIDSEKRIPID